MTRVVIDANVLASAAAGHPHSPSRRLLNALAAGRIEAVLCDRILQEVDRALERPYFAARVTPIERRQLGAVLRAVAEMLPDPVAPPATVRDPRDDYLVALASTGRADAIVTGDRDLLDHEGLKPPAITPRIACERFGRRGASRRRRIRSRKGARVGCGPLRTGRVIGSTRKDRSRRARRCHRSGQACAAKEPRSPRA